MKFINKKLFLSLIFSLFFVTGFLLFNNLVHAQTSSLDLGLKQAASTGLVDTDIRTIIAKIIKAALGLLGIVAVCLVLYAGYLWMTAGGDDEKINSSKKILINASIGLIIILSAYSIVSFVMNKLVEATTGDNSALCDKQKANGGPSCGGDCSACLPPPCPYGNCASGQFTIVQMPATGNVCIQNVAPIVVFNLDVDISTLKDKVVVEDVSTSVSVVGDWSWQPNHHNIAYFKPTNGVCPAPDVGKDCFLATTTYEIKIKNSGKGIQSTDGKDLNCLLSKGGCVKVPFTTGDGVDRKDPIISISYPKISDVDLKQGNDINVKIDFTDDGGLQNMILNVDDILVDSKNFNGCQKSGTATIVWPTNKLDIGDHSLKAVGLDWAANNAEDNSKANLKPAFCFNKVLDLDKGEKFVDCGGVCGICSGDKCAKDIDCTSGFCQKQNANDLEGICVDKTYITDFSPSSAAIGDYVSIIGKNFGADKGHVYFAKIPNPDIKKLATDWTEAQVVNCGGGFNNWSDNQIIVLVPDDAISGKIAIFSAKAIGLDNFNIKYFDTTGDGFKKISNFTLTNISHPGICGLTPNNGSVGASFTAKGKNFGAYDIVKSFVTFSDNTKAKIDGWADDTILSAVPVSLGNGEYGVKVTNGSSQSSNSVLFTVSGSNQDVPLISNISSPVTTTIGDYLTITGKNFGDQIGSVWFKLNGSGNATDGSFIFPNACKNSVWKDNQIVVKVPLGLDTDGKKYTIQIKNSLTGLNSSLDNSKSVTLYVGDPSPGICEISPVSGVVPFPLNKLITASGEYLNNITKFYFWKIGGASNDIVNTLIGADVKIVDDQTLTTVPNSKDITSGLVYAYRGTDKKQSNGLLFSTNDCTKNGCASNNDKCCLSGDQAGMCKPKGELCLGEFKTSGFVWMFSTKEIVAPPQVVERCGAETESGKNLPSPSPSTKWNVGGNSDAGKVCQTALATVEFSSDLKQSTVTDATVIVNSCNSIDVNGVCQGAINIPLSIDSYILNKAIVDAAQNVHPYISLKSQAGKWDANKLYQVIFKDSITSVDDIKGKSLKLVATNPCGSGTAYCFSFKTGIGDCVLKQVVITPNDFWAKYLESPMHYHTAGGDVYDVFYKGNGLSTQYCTMMDVSSFNWQWSVDNKNPGKTYAEINGAGNKIATQINTKANTVGVGVANDSVDIKATASSGLISKIGSSPLTIDLSNPDVVDYWPNCLEACTNASVGAKFNVTMSNHNVAANSPAIKLVQCNDENCFSTGLPMVLAASFDAISGNTILKIANNAGDEVLQPNTLYQVTLSATSAPGAKDSIDQLWSVSDSLNLASFAKPYNKVFTWRFRTKKEACKVDHIAVSPKVFTASKLKDLAMFEAVPYASPDACSATGQKLNPWSQNWDWTSTDLKVATVKSFKTKGSGAYCTANCVLKGSTVPSGQVISAYPICGNDKIEAGEDCDAPNKATGCGLNCKFLGNSNAGAISKDNLGLCGDGFISANKGEACDTNDPKSKVGCSDICLHTGSKMQTAAKEVNASICGNGMIGSGEDCDLGIPPDQSIFTSSMYCSAQCLHLGTKLSSKWCFDHGPAANPAFGGFLEKDYNFFCGQSYSQCGDGVASPDEDVDCEFKIGEASGKHNSWCNDRCLNIDKDHFDTNCAVNKEGCDENAQHIGSALTYTQPSVCGDGVSGVGEDPICESASYITNLWHKDSDGTFLYDPWVLAVGQAGSVGNVVGPIVLAQESDIKGSIVAKNVSGVGKYQVLCGYKTDEQCQDAYSGNLNIGVGNNSCCYIKTKLTGVYPGNTSTVNIAQNICINTFIEADFDSVIDPATLAGNFVIARSAAAACSGGLEDVSNSTSFLASVDSSLPWYKNIWKKIIVTIKNIFGHEVNANTWCAGADVGGVEVIKNSNGGSKVLFNLNKPLASSTDYVIILKKGIKNIQGVSIESKPDGKAIGWRFKTGSSICKISDITIDPDQYYFSIPNANANLVAKGVTENKQLIQPVAGYSWEYQWGPKNNPYVLIGNTTSSDNIIISQNNNGELDVHAAANMTDNKYTDQIGLVGTGKSHIIVFLCENPWPPKQAIVPGQSAPAIIFPYEDKVNNNDGFDLINNIFNNNIIVPSSIGKGYFNFSTYYCADNGSNGNVDDLPYLRPAVQVGGKVCEKKPDVPCESDDDCAFGQIVKGPFGATFNKVKKGYCVNYSPSGAAWSPYLTWLDNAPSILQCNFDSDCTSDPDFSKWYNPAFYSDSKATCKSLASFGLPTSKCSDNVIAGFKRFLFTNDKNNDAIGIQVLANPKHLSPSDWFNNSFGKEAIQDIPPLDGYKAVSDGNNIYVSALNFDSSNVDGKGNLFTNIYLFSINDNAAPETRKVFESLVKNLKFNINLTNYGYCGKDIKNPGDTTQCISDFDCSNGEICSAQKDKLKRNFLRIQDMSSIDKSLIDYSFSHNNTYPDLTAGTYLSGQTISTWPSWSLLSNAFGSTAPSDPINKLGIAGTCSSSTGQFCIDDAVCKNISATETCVLHDSVTGWSTADKRFSFACANDSLAYRYFSTSTSPTSSNYLVKLRMEDSGLVVDNLKALVTDLIKNPSHFNILDNSGNGICNQSKEITTINQGTCGDGKVNLNKAEQCDPPGGVIWNQSVCSDPNATANTLMNGQICANDCKWSVVPTTTKCGILSKCGNGKVEVGEFCDEGALNGKYNHCNLTCSSLASSCGDGVVTSTYEVCDSKFDYYTNYLYPGNNQNFGWCSSGLMEAHPCKTDIDCKVLPETVTPSDFLKDIAEVGTLGKCIPTTFNNSRYGLEKTKSCNFDCQKNGPYCGDGIIQTEFGEECDGNQICSINGVSGNRACGLNCHWDYNSVTTSPILYYNFDNVFIRHIGWNPVTGLVKDFTSFIPNKGVNKLEKSILNTAKCTYSSVNQFNFCPSPTPSENINKNQAMYFNGTSNYFIIDKNPIFNLNEITFATWINIDSSSPNGYNPIFTKSAHFEDDGRNASHNRDYNFYFFKTASGTIDTLHMYSSYFPDKDKLVIGNPPKSNDITILGVSGVDPKISVDEWHHIAITVNALRETRYYVDGNLMNPGNLAGTVFANGDIALKADHSYPLWIGRGDDGYFKGKMDEFHLFGRALSTAEIQDLYQNGKNFCEAKIAPPVVQNQLNVPVGCNNGKVDANEACDNGNKNGVACVPGYNKSCAYCSWGCKNVITLNPTGYCGDGVINGPETCDVDKSVLFSNTLNFYYWNVSGLNKFFVDNNGYPVAACSQEYNLHLNSQSTQNYKDNKISLLTTQIGSRTCINNCSSISNKCVECGMKSDGSKVSGFVLNVLDPASDNPLLASADPLLQGVIDLVYSKNGQDVGAIDKDGVTNFSYNLNDIPNPFSFSDAINSDAICSDASQDRSYRVAINGDWNKNHLIDFPIFGATTSIKYNLLLSPVINQNIRPQDIRVVVSWVGDIELNAGFTIPGGNPVTLEDNSPKIITATGINYYTTSPNPLDGIWYHGFKNANTSNVKSFTINTLGMATPAYAFYVRSPVSPINDLKNSAKLKIEIYTPEDDSNGRHFARPVKTYYLNQAGSSDNAAAQYWHIFNIKKVPVGVASLENSIENINLIRSFIKMNYAP